MASALAGDPTIAVAELDAQEYFAGLAKMAGELRRVSGESDQAGASSERFGAATDNVAGKLTSAVTKGTLYAEVLGKIKDGLVAAFKHAADYEDVVGKEEKAVVSLRQASAGLASDIDIMKAKQRLLQGDYSLTTRELEAMAKAAVYHSRVNETSLAVSFDKVAEVVQKGGRGLKELGITLETTGTDANKTAQVIAELEKRFGGMRFEAENTNERIDVLKNTVKTIVGSIGSAILQSDLFSSALKRMSATAREIADGWANARDPGVQRQVALQNRVQAIRRQLAELGADEQGRLGPAPARTGSQILTALEPFDDLSRKRSATALAAELNRIREEFTQNRLRREREAEKRSLDGYLSDAKAASDRVNTLMEAAARARKPGGKKSEDKEWEEYQRLAKWNDDVDRDIAELRKKRGEERRRADEEYSKREVDLVRDRVRVQEAELERQRELREQGQRWAEEQQEKLRARFGKWEGMDLAEKILGVDSYNNLLRRLDQVGVAGQALAEIYVGAFSGVQQAMGTALFSMISGEKSAGDAARAAFHAFLSSWGQKMTMRALEETAEAIASLARWDLWGMAQHGAAAAAFGAAAIAAGLGAAATKPKEQQKQAAGRGTDRGLGGGASTANRSPSGGNVTFIYNLNTLATREDDFALLVANGVAAAQSRGYLARLKAA